MSRKSKLYLSFVLIAGLATVWGCPKKTEVTTTPETQTQAERISPPTAPPPSAETGTFGEKGEVKSESTYRKEGIKVEGLKAIYFDFDQSYIREDAKAIMKANAAWLKANPKAKIKIEGNCDERGTKEYNQALGQRRAAMAKKYLIDMGISGRRISLISYGKEKSICSEHGETCWQKNRRDDFFVIGD